MNDAIFWMNGADCPTKSGFVTLYSDDCDFLPVKEKYLTKKYLKDNMYRSILENRNTEVNYPENNFLADELETERFSGKIIFLSNLDIILK